MHAHHVVELIGPRGLRWVEVPEPDTTAQLVVEVMAAGVSFADLLYTQGRYQVRPTLPFAPGMDAAGVVRSAPPGSGFEAGQRVAVLAAYGCWQDVITADPSWTLPLPDDMGFEAGAAAPLNYLTSLFALVRRGQAQPGEVLLVHGAAGGVGAAAIQVGRALGLTTIAVTSDERKRAFAAGCGADHAVCGANWREAVREIVGAAGVDLALDPVGGDRLVDSLRLLAPEGRLLVVGFTAGEIPRSRSTGCCWATSGCWGRPRASSSNASRLSWAELWTHYLHLRKTGALADPPVEVWPFADARQALQAVEHRRSLGKNVLSRRT